MTDVASSAQLTNDSAATPTAAAAISAQIEELRAAAGHSRGARQQQRRPHERARREGVAELGPEHVGERQQRRGEQQQPAHQQHRLERVRPALRPRLHPERVDGPGGEREDREVDAGRQLVVEPDLLERDADRHEHRARRDQRAAVRRRAQQLEEPGHQIPGFGTGPSPE